MPGKNPTSARQKTPEASNATHSAKPASETIPEPDALIFDLDGVLADVRRSYRACIKATASFFGTTISREEIATAKRNGNANNDWVLTWNLLAGKGVDVPLDDVIDVFQRFYVGSTGAPGFRERETLLVDPDLLERLRQRYALAIVTGRPGHEAARFLSHFKLSSKFERVVAMEDAPPKPDPTGIRDAVRAVDSERPWMLGDTPDDMSAAVAAGVVAIGICDPEDEAMCKALASAGARVLLTNVNEVTTLLPL